MEAQKGPIGVMVWLFTFHVPCVCCPGKEMGDRRRDTELARLAAIEETERRVCRA
jgi:hypothetical protein